jgi:16S rRNA (guanine(1405)-N(7))-methyltransferase
MKTVPLADLTAQGTIPGMSNEVEVEAVVTAVKQSPKYGDTSEATIRELAEEAVRQHKKTKPAIKAVRTRLHSIMAPYLGDPDYIAEAARLDAAFAVGDTAVIEAICLDCLNAHLSTRERLPILADFYERIFAITGKPQSILDIACGLNPLALRWMIPLSDHGFRITDYELRFHAYDIHEPRIAFINRYFELEGLESLARVQDVAMAFPQEQADVALFLKEMPRFERNYGGRGRPLLEALNAKHLVISYPTISTHGGRNLTNRYRDFMYQLLQGHDWPVTELLFAGELVFIVEKRLGD